MGFFWSRRKAVPQLTGRVVVFGAATHVGRSLSLLLKLNPHVRELVCCGSSADTAANVAVRGVATDLNLIDTDATVTYVAESSQWPSALAGAQVAVVCSGNSYDTLREDRDTALAANAGAVRTIMQAIAAAGTMPVTAILSSPVNALVPLCAEHLKAEGAFDPRKLFGVTTLDVVRTRQLVAQYLEMNPYDVNIPVVGGRGGVTACPLIAQTGLRVSTEAIVRITSDVQQYGSAFAPDEGIGGGDALTTAVAPPVAQGMAYAAHEFIVSVLKAQRGDYGITECALVESTMRPETPFFSSRVQLGREGVEKILPMGAITEFERDLIEMAVPELVKDVDAGIAMFKKAK